MNILAKNLIHLRTLHEKSQSEIAVYLGITRQAYANYENSKRRPDYNTLIKLGKLFSTSIDNLINTDLSKSNVSTKDNFTSEELWTILCETIKTGCSDDEYDGILQFAQNIFDFDVEDRLISENIVDSNIRYRHYNAEDL